MLLRAADANTEVSSSGTSDDKGAESSTAEQGAQTEQAQVDDIVKGLTPQGEKTPDDATGEEKVEGQEENAQSTEEAVEGETKTAEEGKEATTTEAVAEVVVDKPEDTGLEFHKHPRFQELVAEKNTAKEQVARLEPQAKRIEQLDNFLKTNGIQEQEVENALNYLRLRRQNPEQAYQLIKKDYEQLAQYAGDVLPQDLQAKVAAGVIEPDVAKELARARMNQQHQQWNQQSTQQTQQQSLAQSMQGAVDTWASTISKTDTAMRPKAAGAVNGKWEYVSMALGQMQRQNPPTSMEAAVKQAQEAYAEANKFYASVQPKKAAIKAPLQSTRNGASTNGNAVIKTDKDVVKAIFAGKRPHQLKYS